jgi:hypothetical protein
MKENASMIRSNNMPRRGFGLRSLVAAVAVVCSLAAGQSARATDITFNLAPLVGQSSASLTSGGYTLLFTPISSLGSFGGHTDGITMQTPNYFSISKTAGATDLVFKSYTIESTFNPFGNSISFNLTGGTGTSTGNTITSNTTLNYNGSYSLVGSQTVTYNPVNFGVGAATIATFNALTFTAVPEPSTYALGAIATGVMAAVARRRKARMA